MSGVEENREGLAVWLTRVSSAQKVTISCIEPLFGGSIQENLRVECVMEGGETPGPQRFVLRSDSAAVISASLSRSQEFKVMQAVSAIGVNVPEPLWLCEDLQVIGRPFYIMRLEAGIALGPKIVKDQTLGGDREALGFELGCELAKIHSIHLPYEDLDFLEKPVDQPGLDMVKLLRKHLLEMGEHRPVLEWGLRWAEIHCPVTSAITLVHQDFRSGNYLIDGDGLNGILDWEFTRWGDPMSDIAWFCAEVWRFSHPELEAGGVASRESFYDGYRSISENPINETSVFFWEVMAHIRWAVIALQQANRHISGVEKSLELALTGRILPDLELRVLNMTAPARWVASC